MGKMEKTVEQKILFRYEFKNIPDRLGFITAFRVSGAHVLAQKYYNSESKMCLDFTNKFSCNWKKERENEKKKLLTQLQIK